MESEGLPAFCPTCRKEYTFYGDAARLAAEARRASDRRWARPCYACSFRTSPWDALWIPAILLVVMTFPLLWMIWSNLIGPLVFLSPFALALWRRAQRGVKAAALPGSAPRKRSPREGAGEARSEP
jgi:hypothetical protein